MADPYLDELWQRVVAAWADDASHTAFIEHCRSTRQLGEACTRYRELVRLGTAYRDDPSRAEGAQKRLNGIVTLVMVELDTYATAQRESPRNRTLSALRWLAAAICLASSAFLLMQILRR